MRMVGAPAGLAILVLSLAVSYSEGELGIIRLVGAGFLAFSVWATGPAGRAFSDCIRLEALWAGTKRGRLFRPRR